MPRLPVPLLLALAAFALYLAAGQNAMHGLDAYHFLRFVEAGQLHNELTILYQPCAWLWAKALATVDVPLYEAMRALSAIAAALGIACCHRVAVALGWPAARAVLFAVGCAATPAVLHAATVVEVDALFFGCSALAWIPFARLLRGGSWRWAVATGACTALAAGFHGAGQLLVMVLGCLNLAWGFPQRRLRSTAPTLLLLAATHAALTMLLGWIAGSAGQATMASNTAGLTFRAAFLPQVLWQEWLLPYGPFCLLPLLALRPRASRAAAVGFLLCLCGYLVVTTLVLGLLEPTGPALPHGRVVEFGSFLLGSTVPAVLLSLATLPLRAGWLTVAATLLLAIAQNRAQDWPPDPDGYFAGYAAATAKEPACVVVANAREWAWIARRRPGARCDSVDVIELEAQQKQRDLGIELQPEHFALWFRDLCQRQRDDGRQLLLTERALERLRHSPLPHLATAVRELLPVQFELSPVAALGFHAVALRPR